MTAEARLAACLLAAVFAGALSAGQGELEGRSFLSPDKAGVVGLATAEGEADYDVGAGLVDFRVTVFGLAASEVVEVRVCEKVGAACNELHSLALSVFPTYTALDVAATPPLQDALTAGRLWFEVQTTTAPVGLAGEIRVIQSLYVRPIAAKLAQPGPSPATGTGAFHYDAANGTLAYELVAAGLLGTAIGAVVHVGPPGVAGPPLFPLVQTGPASWSGTASSLSAAARVALLSEGLYVQVYTSIFPAGEIRDQIRPGPLNADTLTLSLFTTGRQSLLLDAGVEHAGEIYFVLGSVSGTSPGIPIAPGITLPLNPDPYFNLLLADGGQTIVVPGLGFLDTNGEAEADFVLPPGLMLPVPYTAHHAYALFHPMSAAITLASNPEPLVLVP